MKDLSSSIPLVSICCATFNHIRYVRQCLDGFILQRTVFKFEVIVNDDCSTDGTTDIVKEYERMYPDIVKVIYHDENQYSKGIDNLNEFMFPRCSGKYIALCEGDDYWTDPLKLQKQVDFLESHSEYSMCFHNAIERWEDKSRSDGLFSNVEDRDYNGPEIFEHWTIPTASVLLRKEVVLSDYYRLLNQNPKFCYGDIILFISCAHYGKLRGMSFVGSVYRRHGEGATFNTKRLQLFEHYYAIYKCIGGEYREYARRMFYNVADSLFREESTDIITKLKVMRCCFFASPVKFVWRTAKLFISV